MRISRAVIAAACVSLLALAACGSSQDDPENPNYQGAYLYGTDGNMANEFGALFKEQAGLLDGMKGTLPLTELNQTFTSRLNAVWPGLKDYLFAAETYDAMMISALAAQQAGTVEPTKVAQYINGVTSGDIACRTFQSCLALARDGKSIAYRGITVRHGFTDAGEPSTTSYGTVHFSSANQLDNGKTEYLGTGNELNASGKKPPRPVKNGTSTVALKFGGLLPQTGALAYTAPPMLAAAKLAVKEINDVGGVLGTKVEWVDGNDGTDPRVATATIAKHATEGVHILIGPGASGVALGSLPEAVKNGMIMFSPCNTSASLTTADDKGLYFRTAPSDILQARAIADVILRDGDRKVAIVAHSGNYGTNLAKDVVKELVKAGVSEIDVQTHIYQITDDGSVKDKAELERIAGDIVSVQPDGVLIIGYSESAEMVKALSTAGAVLRH